MPRLVSRYSEEEKIAIVAEANEIGFRPTGKRYGLHPSTIGQWKRRQVHGRTRAKILKPGQPAHHHLEEKIPLETVVVSESLKLIVCAMTLEEVQAVVAFIGPPRNIPYDIVEGESCCYLTQQEWNPNGLMPAKRRSCHLILKEVTTEICLDIASFLGQLSCDVNLDLHFHRRTMTNGIPPRVVPSLEKPVREYLSILIFERRLKECREWTPEVLSDGDDFDYDQLDIDIVSAEQKRLQNMQILNAAMKKEGVNQILLPDKIIYRCASIVRVLSRNEQ